MKKKILVGFAALAIAAVAIVNMNYKSNESLLSNLALANIEALAEGDVGTSAGYCYTIQSYSDTSGWKKFCDNKTNSETIYPCPSTDSLNSYNELSKDRCTK